MSNGSAIWVKICANTTLEDAQQAADAGADAVGFVFAPSPRRVTAAQVAAITRHLPATLEKIGVFVNQSPEIILDTIMKVGLTGVQLHGDEDAEYIRTLAKAAPRKKALSCRHPARWLIPLASLKPLPPPAACRSQKFPETSTS